jgi:hypothetical protein
MSEIITRKATPEELAKFEKVKPYPIQSIKVNDIDLFKYAAIRRSKKKKG